MLPEHFNRIRFPCTNPLIFPEVTSFSRQTSETIFRNDSVVFPRTTSAVPYRMRITNFGRGCAAYQIAASTPPKITSSVSESNTIARYAVNNLEVRLFRKPDFSPGCVSQEGSPANKAKPDFSLCVV